MPPQDANPTPSFGGFGLSLTGVATVLLGYLAQAVMIGTRADKRGYHDLIAKTCVIHDQPEGG